MSFSIDVIDYCILPDLRNVLNKTLQLRSTCGQISRMRRTPEQLREDARQIWWAGVQAVQPSRLIPEHVTVAGETLSIDELELSLIHI